MKQKQFLKDPKEGLTLQQFVKKYFKDDLPATYRTPDCALKDRICAPGSNRSFSGLVELVQTYYPEATERDVAVALKEGARKGLVGFLYCYDIHNLVFFCPYENKICRDWDAIINSKVDEDDYYSGYDDDDVEEIGYDGWNLIKVNNLTKELEEV